MIEEVNKIIYNMLISGRGVLLPEIGALYIERQAARKLADGRLLTPRNVVLFSKQEQAPSLVDEIVAIASCSTEQAQDIYNKIKDMDITITQDMKDSIGNFFTGILDKVLKLLGGFLG